MIILVTRYYCKPSIILVSGVKWQNSWQGMKFIPFFSNDATCEKTNFQFCLFYSYTKVLYVLACVERVVT